MNAEPITKVTVLGLGTMGHGIVQTFALAGCRVRSFDSAATMRETAVERITTNLNAARNAGLVTQAALDDALGFIEICETEEESLAEAEFVTEAVAEELDVKQELFARIESKVSQTCILASNTSSFPMTEIATGLRHPERTVNTHWFNPPHIVPLVEVVPGEKTEEDTVQKTLELLERIGKVAIRLNVELTGFLVNRVQIAMYREIFHLLECGVASAEDIDRALTSSVGLRLAAIGPLAVYDFAGIDINSRAYRNLVPHIRSDTDLPGVVQKLVDAGHFGVKTGKGIYEYTEAEAEEQRTERDRRYLELIKLFYNGS